MKRGYSQNCHEYDQANVSAVQLQEECKKANEQIKSVEPCSKTNQFEHHHHPKTRTKEASHQYKHDEEVTLQQSSAVSTPLLEDTRTPNEAEGSREDTGRERLKRHRVEVAGRVWIPDIWGQEELLKDWIDCSAFDAAIMNSSIMSARAALVKGEGRTHSSRFRIVNGC